MNPLEKVRAEIADLTRKIGVLKQTEKLLASVYDDTDGSERVIPEAEINLSEVGMTKAVEAVLATSPGVPFVPTAVRDALLARKFQLSGDNPMAPIHQTLKR